MRLLILAVLSASAFAQEDNPKIRLPILNMPMINWPVSKAWLDASPADKLEMAKNLPRFTLLIRRHKHIPLNRYMRVR